MTHFVFRYVAEIWKRHHEWHDAFEARGRDSARDCELEGTTMVRVCCGLSNSDVGWRWRLCDQAQVGVT